MSDDRYRLGVAGAIGNGATFCLMRGFEVLGSGFYETHNLIELVSRFVKKPLHVYMDKSTADSALYDAIMNAPSNPEASYHMDEDDRLRYKLSPCSDLQVAHMLCLSSFDADELQNFAEKCQKMVN